MNRENLELMKDINGSIIKIRGAYAEWTKRQNRNYYEMLIFYSLRENTTCTQSQICTNYCVPKQSINNIIKSLHENDYICFLENDQNKRSKKIQLTSKGKTYYDSLIQPLSHLEENAVKLMGPDKLLEMTKLSLSYADIITKVLLNDKEQTYEK